MNLLAAVLVLQAGDAFQGPCDQAAAHLAAGRAKEAVALLEPLARGAVEGPGRDRLFYTLGCAAYAAGNDLLAGRSLARLAPFEQPLYAAHARYLLGRIHHRAGELTEAAAQYEAVGPAFEKMPAEKKSPVPDFVAEAVFHAGVLLYERKDVDGALARFQHILQKEKRPELVEEARLRAGLCQVRVKQPAEALKTLAPLLTHARLARAARWWSAQAVLADPAKAAEAADHLAKALEAAESPAGPTTADVLLALGEALERAGRAEQAVEAYRKAASGPNREEGLARLAGALAAAGKIREAEEAAGHFSKAFPSSPHGAGLRLRLADAAFAEAQKAGGEAALPLLEAAVKRYAPVLAEASGPVANLARYRTACALYRLNRPAEALAQLRSIPDGERTGELAGVFALQGECLLRSSPPAEDAADAIQAAALLKDLQEAAGQFERAASAGATPELAMKLAEAVRQTAALLADPAERGQAATRAREMYEAFRNQHPAHPLRPVAEYERANCYALAGDPNTAIQKLERFKAPPFADAPVAPLALLRQGQLYRQAGHAGQAVAVLADCRARHEAALLKDASRAAWVPLIRYQHAAALKAANNPAEAATVLESLVKDFGASEWAEPARRLLKEVKP